MYGRFRGANLKGGMAAMSADADTASSSRNVRLRMSAARLRTVSGPTMGASFIGVERDAAVVVSRVDSPMRSDPSYRNLPPQRMLC